jgi:mannose-6-phosphate isomerase-like protein (cupin superfamily)
MEVSVSHLTGATLPAHVIKETPSGPVLGLQVPLIDGEPAAAFKMSFWRLNPDTWTNWDQHEVLEIWMIAGGSGTLWREHEATRVSAGDAVFMPSQTRHRLHNDGGEPMQVFSIWWTFEAKAPQDV